VPRGVYQFQKLKSRMNPREMFSPKLSAATNRTGSNST
ncbi:unnamed protein product, partial [Acidithrix sp. C25]